MTNRLLWLVGVGLALVVGILAGVALSQEYALYRLQQANVAALVQLANYNLAQGVLKPMPTAAAAGGPGQAGQAGQAGAPGAPGGQ